MWRNIDQIAHIRCCPRRIRWSRSCAAPAELAGVPRIGCPEWGVAAEYYHGQRRKADRERVQAAFMDGQVRVIVATNAFGLGVDKPDVRFVIHRDVPGSVEAYYQEAGRAGCDGEPARCVLTCWASTCWPSSSC